MLSIQSDLWISLDGKSTNLRNWALNRMFKNFAALLNILYNEAKESKTVKRTENNAKIKLFLLILYNGLKRKYSGRELQNIKSS